MNTNPLDIEEFGKGDVDFDEIFILNNIEDNTYVNHTMREILDIKYHMYRVNFSEKYRIYENKIRNN